MGLIWGDLLLYRRVRPHIRLLARAACPHDIGPSLYQAPDRLRVVSVTLLTCSNDPHDRLKGSCPISNWPCETTDSSHWPCR